ncbi:MAG: hypothetical protein GOU99_02505 [Candidatus Altiarchaeota archaeon]|nr:hypothetical protein [Candidatus Altiarchaeota archaeon]
MKSKIVLGLFVLVLSAACIQQDSQSGPEHFNYSWGGFEYSSIFYPEIMEGMRWIQENTAQDATILAWWDYGHMIRGKTGRDTILFGPSREILFSVAKYAALSQAERDKVICVDCNPHAWVEDVADALVTTDPDKTAEIMHTYGAEYVLVTEQEVGKSYSIMFVAGLDPHDYLTADYEPLEPALEMVLFRMLSSEEISGFELVYSDSSVWIYQLS